MIAALLLALALQTSTGVDTSHRAASTSTTVTVSTSTGDSTRRSATRVDSGGVTGVTIAGGDSAAAATDTTPRRVPALPAVKLPTSLIAPSPLPAWILYAVVGTLLALVLVLAAHRGASGERLAVWLVHPFTGTDGRLSFSKLVCVGVLVHYAISANLPAVVACWIIAASFGTKVLLAVVEKTGLSASAASTIASAFSRTESDAETRSASTSDSKSDSKSDTRSESHNVNEQITRTIVEERGPTGEPPRSLPPMGATTPDGAQ
jgi:hypothetical protein